MATRIPKQPTPDPAPDPRQLTLPNTETSEGGQFRPLPNASPTYKLAWDALNPKEAGTKDAA
jgi:hypothetical protein